MDLGQSPNSHCSYYFGHLKLHEGIVGRHFFPSAAGWTQCCGYSRGKQKLWWNESEKKHVGRSLQRENKIDHIVLPCAQ